MSDFRTATVGDLHKVTAGGFGKATEDDILDGSGPDVAAIGLVPMRSEQGSDYARFELVFVQCCTEWALVGGRPTSTGT